MAIVSTRLQQLLNGFAHRHEAEVAAVVSRSGLPVAARAPEGVRVDHFAAMSATLMGASEVVCRGFGRKGPKRVRVDLNGGVMLTAGVGPRVFVVAVVPEATDGVVAALAKLAGDVGDVLKDRD
jgi:predicted regulator of Ras-like GTPase activity (Roadblock/LC7/MglB family)